MAMTTGGRIGSLKPDNLVAHIYPPCEVFMVELNAQGSYERGTVLSREEDGTYAVLGEGKGKASCVVAETTMEDDSYAQAYRTGHFYRNALIAAEGHELTDEEENDLRMAGILLSDGI